jgi:hypothetical protein
LGREVHFPRVRAARELTEGDVVPPDSLGMRETKLLIGGSDNADARLR